MEKIRYDGKVYEAARCEECGGMMFPPSALAEHERRHRVRRMELRKRWLEPLKRDLLRSRL